MNPFNLIDLVSCVSTLITMGLWLRISFSKLAQGFFFPEVPEWTALRITTSTWKNHAEVLQAFEEEGERIRTFLGFVAVNSIIIFCRTLKYFQIFPSCEILFNTLRSATVDLFFFVMLIVVTMTGFVYMGHHLFGSQVQGFSSLTDGFLTCSSMFLGDWS